MNYRRQLILLLFPLFFISCETDFDLNAEWQDITVVYGILNQNDSIHYIRIQKAFLGEGNIMQMALEPDSNLYQGKLDVIIEEWSNNTLQRTLLFDTITIDNKEPGLFFYPNQLLYYTHAEIDPAYSYRLKITNPETGKLITSETELVGDFSVVRPVARTSINFHVPANPTRIFAWRPAKNAGRYQMILRFNYLELDLDVNDTISKHLDWKSPIIKSSSLNLGGDIEIRFSNEIFFSMVENQIPILDNVIRYPKNIELIFHVAANELSTYIDINEPTSSLVQVRPEYTNIENGLGVFSARYDKTSVHPIHFQTLNRLFDMEGYNFQRLLE